MTLAARAAIAFACAYFALYTAEYWLGLVPPLGMRWEALRHAAVPWLAAHVLHLPEPITVFPNGSGDTSYNWLEVGAYVAIAAALTPAWVWLDGRRPHLEAAARALHVGLRYTVAAAMIGYGLAKLPPGQFPPPSEATLAMAVGDMTPMKLLWTFMGFSPAYALFAGAAEVVGGALLLFRRTATLGALIVLGVLTNIVMLNLCYDVPVKSYSSHLLAMTLIVLWPDAQRLADAVLAPRPAFPAERRAARVARRVLKTGFVGFLLVMAAFQVQRSLRAEPPGPTAAHPLTSRGFHWINERPYTRADR